MVSVAVIGAGSAGLLAVKTCKEYNYDVVCYEKTDYVGGLWCYKPHQCQGEASVMKSTIIKTSKELCAVSDYPPPKEYPNFMHNTKVLEYFRSYAQHFDIIPHIKFQKQVQLIKRADDYENSGRWLVTVKDIKSGQTETEIFDGVLICTGHHVNPHVPQFVGLREKFSGTVLHSHAYKDSQGFEDKNVLVVGIGNSGGDVVVELSRTSKQVHLSTRRGTWLWHCVYDKGEPFDMFVNSHLLDPFMRNVPRLVQALFERKLQQRFDLETYGLLPAHHLLQQHPTVNDELPYRVATGRVIVKPNVKEFTGPKSCTFQDGTSLDDIDAVVLCTGYYFGFPCLESGVIPVEKNRVTLFKNMYAPDLSHPETLAVIGLVQPVGAIFPIAEMQCRVFCEYLQGKRVFPTRDEMYQDIKKKEKELHDLYVESNRHTIQVPYIPFMTELAEMIDSKPSSPFTYLLKGDPKLAWALAVGPCVAYEFRLRGPHPWPGARDAIVTVWDRVIAASKTRQSPAHLCGSDRSHGLNCVVKDNKALIGGVLAGLLVLIMAVLLAF